MGKFEPSNREKELVFSHLPAQKDVLVALIQQDSLMPESYVRSLIWNMKRLGLIYTDDNHLLKKV